MAIVGQTDSERLSLACIAEPSIYADAYLGGAHRQRREELLEFVRSKLEEIGQQHIIPPERQFLEAGQTARQLHEIANREAVDLIVIGSHGRHGVQLLLGSTANAVLHGASCDVLAVRIEQRAT